MKALAILPALALASCAASSPPPEPTGLPTAGLGQTASVDSLLVTPLALVEDSRCPADVQCVWAGRLVVRAEIRAGADKQVRDLELAAPQEVAGGKLSLSGGEPDKKAGQSTNPADYRFTFLFVRGVNPRPTPRGSR